MMNRQGVEYFASLIQLLGRRRRRSRRQIAAQRSANATMNLDRDGDIVMGGTDEVTRLDEGALIQIIVEADRVRFVFNPE